MRKIYTGLLLLVMFLINCGGGDGNGSSSTSEYKLGDSSYTVLTDESLSHSTDVVSGSGSIAFSDPTKDQDNSFGLTFSLQDRGSLSLVSNSGEGLKNGIAIKFTRAGSNLKSTLLKDTTEVDISSKFSNVDATKELAMQIDIHNSENPSHILIWNGSDFSEAKAVFNSEVGPQAPGQGAGNNWGLILKDSSVKTASVSQPKFQEE